MSFGLAVSNVTYVPYVSANTKSWSVGYDLGKKGRNGWSSERSEPRPSCLAGVCKKNRWALNLLFILNLWRIHVCSFTPVLVTTGSQGYGMVSAMCPVRRLVFSSAVSSGNSIGYSFGFC